MSFAIDKGLINHRAIADLWMIYEFMDEPKLVKTVFPSVPAIGKVK